VSETMVTKTTNDLVIIDAKGIESRLQIDEIKKFIAPTANDQEFWMFIQTAKMLNLNPIKREIYFVKYQEKAQIIVGYQIYLQRALESGLIEYWNVEVDKGAEPLKRETWKGIFTARRKDWSKDFTWIVPMNEVDKKQATWNLMPEFLLKKNTLAQGMRMLIPEILGSLPYTSEEVSSGASESLAEIDLPQGQFIEPSPSEQEAKDNAKNAFLEKLMVDLTAITTIDELDKKYKANKAKYETSEMKDSVFNLYAIRKKQLWLELLSTKTGFSAYQVDEYMEQAGDIGGLITECVAGNVEAINQLTAQMAEYLNVPVDREPGEEG
jgi:hypothetical protein